MYDCFNCGMPPDVCMCIPWCYKHDRRDAEPRCQECAKEWQEKWQKNADLKSIKLPWYVLLWRFLSGN